MGINDSVIINIYLIFRSRYCFGLFSGLRFLDLFTIFIVNALRGMKAFPLNFLVGGWFLLTDSFHRFSGEKPSGLHEVQFTEDLRKVKLSGEACVLCCVYLFIIYLFIACLYVCFLITLRELFVGSCINYVAQHRGGWGAISVFWWDSSGLNCSPLDLMQYVMKSLPSSLIYCCHCLQLLLCVVSMDKPVY